MAENRQKTVLFSLPWYAGSEWEFWNAIFSSDTLTVAREFIGKKLVRESEGKRLGRMVVETEAYSGENFSTWWNGRIRPQTLSQRPYSQVSVLSKLRSAIDQIPKCRSFISSFPCYANSLLACWKISDYNGFRGWPQSDISHKAAKKNTEALFFSVISVPLCGIIRRFLKKDIPLNTCLKTDGYPRLPGLQTGKYSGRFFFGNYLKKSRTKPQRTRRLCFLCDLCASVRDHKKKIWSYLIFKGMLSDSASPKSVIIRKILRTGAQI